MVSKVFIIYLGLTISIEMISSISFKAFNYQQMLGMPGHLTPSFSPKCWIICSNSAIKPLEAISEIRQEKNKLNEVFAKPIFSISKTISLQWHIFFILSSTMEIERNWIMQNFRLIQLWQHWMVQILHLKLDTLWHWPSWLWTNNLPSFSKEQTLLLWWPRK